jgi:hypothetical protein
MEENKQTKEERYSLRSAALFLAALGCRAASAWTEQPKPFGWSTAAVRMATPVVQFCCTASIRASMPGCKQQGCCSAAYGWKSCSLDQPKAA